MRFTETRLKGAFLIEPERQEDERGFFARTFCQREFEERGLESRLVQCSISYNARKGTLRGMHYQAPPHEEAKLISCIRGSIHDVILDVRETSPTFGEWVAQRLTAGGFELLYVPPGCAHGFLTLEDDTAVYYQISEFYHPEDARGVRWDDPAFGIEWPFEPTVMSPRDARFPGWSSGEATS
jgi:dTDP-4-dehydrorhamnose 3,5-epimerase